MVKYQKFPAFLKDCAKTIHAVREGWFPKYNLFDNLNMDLEYRFDYLKNNLFPYWDLNQEWKVTNNYKMIKEIGNKLGSKFIGYCDSESKTIYLDLHEDDWKIDMLIVHEICHTFRKSSTHGKLWNNKMIKVSDQCDIQNNYRLADQIRHELENYESI